MTRRSRFYTIARPRCRRHNFRATHIPDPIQTSQSSWLVHKHSTGEVRYRDQLFTPLYVISLSGLFPLVFDNVLTDDRSLRTFRQLVGNIRLLRRGQLRLIFFHPQIWLIRRRTVCHNSWMPVFTIPRPRSVRSKDFVFSHTLYSLVFLSPSLYLFYGSCVGFIRSYRSFVVFVRPVSCDPCGSISPFWVAS